MTSGRHADLRADSLPVSGYEILQLQQAVFTVLHHLLCVQVLHEAGQDPTHTHTQTYFSFTFILMSLKHKMMNSVCVCVCETSSHWVSAADVFARSLDDGLAGLVERPVDPVVGSRVGRLDQRLQLRQQQKFGKHSIS